MSGSKAPKNSIDLQDRDTALLRGLFESRVMTSAHAAALYFDGKPQAAKKRLQKLKAAGFITERPRRAFDPSVLFLTRQGLMLLQTEGVLNDYPAFTLPALERRARVSPLTIRHELEVMDVKTALHAGIRSMPAIQIDEFTTWPLLHEFTVERSGYGGVVYPMKPDGFIRIHESAADDDKFEHLCFVELDRSEEVQDKLIAKAERYLAYYKSGGFAVRHGGTRDDFKQFPFRVLMVLKSAERRNNTIVRLLQNSPPILTMVWLTTYAEAIKDPFGPIWVRPVDYRDATHGTKFAADRQAQSFIYRRNSQRETFVDLGINKRRLLEN